ncbi:toxin-antitoxin system [Corynebacterium sp. CCUG 65737]|uniref:FitA-like ribbon-helix-helix domain-containing protein n=1 Tax=Corynebacterium sp. CCUG 65737 TaxID=2823889 RepID=UPI00210C24B1|nr:toxin-antitoxin system [Corynebacterium sp. CCUG 65737]MCQ4626368.1 toxin-antitoxin system [Corynebacterium sp. CCUG 65737]
MTSIIVRGLDAHVKARLADQAARNGRSMEAEARAILEEATRPRNLGLALYEAAQQHGGVDIIVPPREGEARVADVE